MALPAYYSAATVSLNGISIAEGMSRSSVDDAIRQLANDLYNWSLTVPSGTIAIAGGGTGQTTAAAALAALGGLGTAYQGLPQSAKSAAFQFDLTQQGGHVYYTGAAAAATLPANATVAFPVGTTIMVINNGTGALTITRAGAAGMIWASTNANADRVLAVGGMCSIVKVATDLWFISGANLT